MSAAPPNADELEGTEQPFVSHLIELRDRLIRILWGVGLVFFALAAWPGPKRLYDLLAMPLIKALPAGAHMIAVGVVAPFLIPIKVTVLVAFSIALPWVLFQVWGFVAPGLYKNEKRFAAPLLFSSILLFYCGMAFAYFLVFPGIFHFLVQITPVNVKMAPDISEYLSFVLTMFLSFGIAFEVPIVVILLVLTGIVQVEKLTKSRGYVIIGIFVVSAIITPTTDAISQLAMAGPMWLLFEGGVIVARLMTRNRPQAEADEDARESGA